MVVTFGDGPVRNEIERLGIPVEVISRPRHSVIFLPLFLAEVLRIVRELSRLIDLHCVDVLQTHMLQVLDFAVLSLRCTSRLRVVLWTMQNVHFLPEPTQGESKWFRSLKRAGYLLLYRLLSSCVYRIIAVSEEVRRSVIRQAGLPPEKVLTIRNAVDLGQLETDGNRNSLCEQIGIEPHSSLILSVGRLVEQKGHTYLLDAAQSVVSVFSKAHFLIAGEGELRNRLEQQVVRLGLKANIHFLGSRADVPELLAATDLFVLPSLWEGLSVALLEAMVAGKPIVATAVSGTTEVMNPGETGVLVRPGNSQALADAILRLLENPTQAQAMGMAAKQQAEACCSAQVQADEHLELYSLALKTREA
jgi:glycosyltransferase involved in cell wall biosynthesis